MAWLDIWLAWRMISDFFSKSRLIRYYLKLFDRTLPQTWLDYMCFKWSFGQKERPAYTAWSHQALFFTPLASPLKDYLFCFSMLQGAHRFYWSIFFNLIPSNIHPLSSLPHFIFISHSSLSPCAIHIFYLFLKLLSHYFFFSHFCLILQLIPPSSFQRFNLAWLLLSPGYIQNQHSKHQC